VNKNIEKYNIHSPPDMVLLFDTHPGWNQSGGPELLTTDNHKGDGCNVLFVDGHVDFVKTEDLNKLRWTPD
jgi:prepilin-type processing-associated H-X9-DG protein